MGKKVANVPAEVRQLRGDDRAVVMPVDKLPVLDPNPPAELTSKYEKKLYREVVTSASGTQLYRITDKWLLVGLVQKMALAQKLKAEITLTPFRKKDKEGRRPVKDAVRAFTMLRKDILLDLRELGFTPAARERFMLNRSETELNVRSMGYDIHSASEA